MKREPVPPTVSSLRHSVEGWEGGGRRGRDGGKEGGWGPHSDPCMGRHREKNKLSHCLVVCTKVQHDGRLLPSGGTGLSVRAGERDIACDATARDLGPATLEVVASVHPRRCKNHRTHTRRTSSPKPKVQLESAWQRKNVRILDEMRDDLSGGYLPVGPCHSTAL